jgi:hypothetical protein
MGIEEVEFMRAMFSGKHAREQRHLRWQAPTAWRNGLFIEHSLGRHGINMWRRGAAVPIAREVLRSGSIDQQNEDVWHSCHGVIESLVAVVSMRFVANP